MQQVEDYPGLRRRFPDNNDNNDNNSDTTANLNDLNNTPTAQQQQQQLQQQQQQPQQEERRPTKKMKVQGHSSDLSNTKTNDDCTTNHHVGLEQQSKRLDKNNNNDDDERNVATSNGNSQDDDDDDHQNHKQHKLEKQPHQLLEQPLEEEEEDNMLIKQCLMTNLTNKVATPCSRSADEALKLLDPAIYPNDDMSPDTFIKKLFQIIMGFPPIVRPTLEICSLRSKQSDEPFIPPITEEEQADYCTAVVTAVRENDLQRVRSFHSDGRSLSCSNRFGESLLHMACRRGFESIVLFLIDEAHVSVRITDDCGRTPLHDALWNQECQYTILDLLVRTDPVLLLTCDKRGHTPFAYARREHWPHWRKFLWDRREHMQSAIDATEMELFRSSSTL